PGSQRRSRKTASTARSWRRGTRRWASSWSPPAGATRAGRSCSRQQRSGRSLPPSSRRTNDEPGELQTMAIAGSGRPRRIRARAVCEVDARVEPPALRVDRVNVPSLPPPPPRRQGEGEFSREERGLRYPTEG